MRQFLLQILFMFLISNLFAQDWNGLYNAGQKAYTAKKYREAVENLETAQHLAETQFGKTSSRYRTTIEFLAKAYDSLEQFEKSVILYKGLRDLLKNENKSSSVEYADVQMSLGFAYSKIFEKVRKSKEISDVQKDEYYRLAVEAVKSSYEIRKNLNLQKSNPFTTSLSALARLSSYKKSEGKNTEKYYAELIEAVANFQGKKSDFYLACLIDYADFLSDKKQFANAFKFYDEHIVTSESLKKPKKQILDSYAKRAFCAVKLGEKGSAIKNYADYFTAFEAANGLKDKDFPKIIDRAIKNLETLGATAELERFFLKKIESIRLQFGDQSIEYGEALEDFGMYKIELKQYERAREFIEKGIAIFKTKKGENSIEYMNGNDNLGRLYEQTGQFEKAEATFKATQELRSKYLGENSNEFTFGMDSLGKYYLRRGKLVEADTMFARSLRTRAVQPGKKHAYYGMALGNRAELLLAKGENTQAEKLLRQQNEVFKQHYGEVSFEVGVVNFKLAQLCIVLKRPDEAMKLFKDCTSLFQSVSNDMSDYYVEKSQAGFVTAQEVKNEMNKK